MIQYNQKASSDVGVKRFIRKIVLNLSRSKWIPSSKRYKLIKKGGVNIEGPCFIGEDVLIDTIRPDLISIGERSLITARCTMLTHFRKGSTYYYGTIEIGKRVFIGIGTIIANSVTIGDDAIVGAGSIVTKDIPAGEIWAGNPAKFIRKRDDVKL